MKPVELGDGEKCRRCKTQMKRYGHKPEWKPKKGQPYYFTYWDKCRCGFILMHEAAKVMLITPYDELTEEYCRIMGQTNG